MVLCRCKRPPEPGERAIANTLEREPQERIGDPEQALQRKVGVVGDAGAALGRPSKLIVSREITAPFSPRKVTACGGS